MARSSSFGFTNTTDQTSGVTVKKLGLVSNYAVTGQTAKTASLANKTAPIDVEELVTFQSFGINRVDTGLNIQYPSPVQKGVCYQITEEATLSTTDSADADFRVDEPIYASLQIRHPRSGNITGAHVATIVARLLSACMHDDGTWRFDDFMRGAERPIAD